MRIAFHADGPRIRGNERQTLQLVRGLVGRGHEVVASCRRRGPVRQAMEVAGARTTGIRPRGDADLYSLLRFALWLRRENVDALVVASWKRAVTAGCAARLAGVPLVAMRVGGLRGPQRGGSAWLRRVLVPRLYDVIVVNSGMVRDEMLGDMPGLRADWMPVIPNGVSFQPAPPRRLREELGLPPDSVLLMGVGGLERNKGLDLLAAALGRLDEGVHALVAGHGREAGVDAVRRAAAGAGAEHRLHVLGHRRDVPALLASVDAFVLPSRADSMPNALLEAMGAGCPAVLTDVGGIREVLGAREGRPAAGWIVPRDDVAALSDCLREVVAGVRSGSADVAARVREAKWRAEHWYSTDRMVEAYEAVLTGSGGP